MEESYRSEIVSPSPILNPGLIRSSRFLLFFKKETGVVGHCLGPSCTQFVSGTGIWVR